MSRSKPTCKLHAWIKDNPYHKLKKQILFVYYVFSLKAILSCLNSSSGLSSDKRQEDGAMLEEWGLSLPHAFALGFLSFAPAACQGSLPQPLPPLHHFCHGWHSPPLHPSVYSLYHPSINEPFTEAAEPGLSSSFWGMQPSCLHISRDLKTSALIEPLLCVVSHPAGITIYWTSQSLVQSHWFLWRRMANSQGPDPWSKISRSASGLNLELVGSWWRLVMTAHLTCSSHIHTADLKKLIFATTN